MHLSRVHIEDLRGVSETTLDLLLDGSPARQMVLIGANGVGKTTLLEAVAHVMNPLTEGAQAERLTTEDVRSGRTNASVVVTVHWTEQERRRFPAGKDVPSTLSWTPPGGLGPSQLVGLDPGTTKEQPFGARFVTALMAPLLTMASAHLLRPALEPGVPPCVYLPADRGLLQWRPELPVEQLEHRPLLDALSRNPRRWTALAARLALAHQRPPDDPEARPFHRTWQALKRHFPSMPAPSHTRGLLLWMKSPGGSALPIYRPSDGQRALLLVLAELAYRNPQGGVVLFDEPEQHLHPAWNLPLQMALQELYPDTQFLYTTHSPLFAHHAAARRLLGSDEALNQDA